MPIFLVKGGKSLEGEIEVSGSKNASLPALAASLLFKNKVEFQNLPAIEDIKRMKELLENIKQGEFNYEIAKQIRASILAVGPALARYGKAVFPHPGGCVIGARPIDVFLDGWKAMGATFSEILPSESNKINSISAYEIKSFGGLKGCDYTFRTPSVTGTEGLMMTAVLAHGETTLRNAAMEPEIFYLAEFLNKNGAQISGAGTHTISINGRDGKLLEGNMPFCAPPDRIEAGSFLVLGALLAKNLVIKNFPADELSALLTILKAAGVEFAYSTGKAGILTLKQVAALRAVNIKTQEYPGFPTDLQAPFAILATQAEGASMIHETIFEGRLNYVEHLNRMGAKITLCDPHRAIIYGASPLKGLRLESPDIRAGLAFLIAALVAEGDSTIGNIYQIDRGYEKIDKRLNAIGADIKRI